MKGHLTCGDTIWCIEVSPAGRFDCVVVTCICPTNITLFYEFMHFRNKSKLQCILTILCLLCVILQYYLPLICICMRVPCEYICYYSYVYIFEEEGLPVCMTVSCKYMYVYVLVLCHCGE